MLCASILYISGGNYCLTSTPNHRIFEKLFRGRLIYFQSFQQKSAEKNNRRRNIFSHISFWYLTWETNPGYTHTLPIRLRRLDDAKVGVQKQRIITSRILGWTGENVSGLNKSDLPTGSNRSELYKQIDRQFPFRKKTERQVCTHQRSAMNL